MPRIGKAYMVEISLGRQTGVVQKRPLQSPAGNDPAFFQVSIGWIVFLDVVGVEEIRFAG